MCVWGGGIFFFIILLRRLQKDLENLDIGVAIYTYYHNIPFIPCN